jgi:hypothetical protein
MKLLAAMFTVALITTVNFYPASAQTEEPRTPALTEEEENVIAVKDLFKRQLLKPDTAINVGIEYYIELKDGGSYRRANNKTAFHSGDRVRFHLKPNIDGYAYIVMRNGSGGQKTVLFPDDDNKSQNQITRGKEIVIPPDGDFEFDDHPGVEKLRLYVSRKPIDPATLAKDGEEETKPVAIASSTGRKDLIPSGIMIAYVPEDNAAKHKPAAQVATKDARPVPLKIAHRPIKAPTVAAKKTKQALANKAPVHDSGITHAVAQKPMPAPAVKPKADAATVTIVSNDTDGVLAADVSLEHF